MLFERILTACSIFFFHTSGAGHNRKAEIQSFADAKIQHLEAELAGLKDTLAADLQRHGDQVAADRFASFLTALCHNFS